MELNPKAFEHAKSLILAGKVDKASDWNDLQPSPSDENSFLKENDWDTYSEWFLGLDKTENEGTREYYSFPFGDFEKIHRSGLIAAKKRAGQYHYDEIEDAIDQLLVQMDKEPDVIAEASDESFPASDPPGWRERR